MGHEPEIRRHLLRPPKKPACPPGSVWRCRRIEQPVYDGSHAGTCGYFLDRDGSVRADLHCIMGTWTNTAET